ncbi:cytochrome P450 [Dactylosporangium roseum]|uniref:Cytochrome P450 n=1 Tax=Dactylosporangium roseum TaxID=47989 RepID=A0ABY5ZE93_9ACTN|nr:cytochrome P450 [Dactylosporangium roseum]UWZ39270.1 cytochrome P450 [Dactylosporangium roseum]
MTRNAELLFNPFEPGFAEDPYPAYRKLRQAEPVHESPIGVWLISGYADVMAVLRSQLSVDPRNIQDGPFSVRLIEGRALSMLDRDPPDHTRLRSLVAKVFTRRSIAALEPLVTGLVDDALNRIAVDGRADLVDALAFPLPFEVISRMLGMPRTDTAYIRDLSGKIVHTLDVVADEQEFREIERATAELDAIVADAIAWKRTHPTSDLLTALVEAEDQGDRLSDDELIAQVELLFVAGHETTVNLISGGVEALLRHPAQLALLRDTPDLAPNALEELLRFVNPVQQSRRITIKPWPVRDGRVIPPGTFVIAMLAAANHDESFWGPTAEQLDITRPNARQHLAFGGGPHHCLGAALARLEGRIAVTRLVQRFPGLAFDPAQEVTWNGRISLHGPARLPIVV